MAEQTIWQKLAAPFPFEEIEIKPQTVSERTGKALAIAYINARAAQTRLDDVFSPEGWSFEVRECHVAQKGAVIGRLTITLGDKTIVREDACEITDIEAVKGGVSGAFKRCFSALGCRYLYEIDMGWQACKLYAGNGGKQKFDGWTPDALKAMKGNYERQLKGEPFERGEAPVEPPKEPVQEATGPKYPGSGEFLRSLELTADEVAGIKTVCKTMGLEWGAVALKAKAAGAKDLADFYRLGGIAREPVTS